MTNPHDVNFERLECRGLPPKFSIQTRRVASERTQPNHFVHDDRIWAIVSLRKEANKHGRRCDVMQLRGTGECGKGGCAFPVPLAHHHLVILSITDQPLFSTPVLTAPLMVLAVEGYFTTCLVSSKNGVSQTET